MKKGQKQEIDTATSTEKFDTQENNDAEEEEEDEDWFKVKEKPDPLEELTVNLTESNDREKKITKAKLAKKLRKKNVLINKHIEYDEEGNVSNLITKNNLVIVLS